ncbi:ATPase [Methanobacterium sp.]|uniref:ATPase n=1 Tax=Methanobacterium sp. TaxID=2164 RepID=UPI003D647B1E
MKYKKEDIIRHICKIREEIGHQEVKPSIEDIIFDEEDQSMLIIASDRPEKSIIIGKGGWVVGKLKEKLNINSIHIEAYPDILLREYKAKLTLNKLENILDSQELDYKEPLENLKVLLKERIKKIYNFEDNLNKFKDIEEPQENLAVVALSGGVDSSFSLIVAKTLGFNPIAVTVNPGSIILPKYFHKSVEELSNKLNVDHIYIEVNMDDVIKDSLEGRFHPCGRCSKLIKKSVLDYAKELGVKYLIYGDTLSTGSQSIVIEDGIVKINLPAMLSVTKGEIKNIASKYGILSKGGYGCPLINEVHKKYPHMRKFSIQRVLRETRAGVLEPGEALEMIMKSI